MSHEQDSESEGRPSAGDSNTTALSLFIIILAFFIFTVAISKPEDSKKNSLLASVEKAFGGLSMAERKTSTKEVPKNLTKVPVDFTPVIQADSELSKYAEIRVEYDYSAILLPSDFFFDEGKTSLKPESHPTLDKVAGLIKSGGYSAEVTGYPSGSGLSSARLAAMRAMTIQLYMGEKGGIPVTMLSSFGWTGKKTPDDAKTDIAGNSPELIEITFRAGKGISEGESFKFKDFLFKITD